MDDATFEMLRDHVRRFVRERLLPLEARVEEEDRLPEEVIAEMKALGLFGLTVPEEFGGLGLTTAEETEIILELTYASLAFRSIMAMNIGVGSQGIVADGTAEQKQRWLPAIASGEVIASFALTEPDSGSDSAALRTSAVREGDSYILNGTKRFISNAPHADLITVMARTNPERLPKNAHVTAFLVPATSAGVRIGPKDRKMGQRGAASADVILDNVRVPASAILGREGGGFATAMKVLDRGRIGVAAVCVGQGRRILDEAARYALERRQFGQPIGEFQLVQAMLADSRAELFAAECMVRETARRHSEGANVSEAASCCKMFASEMVGRLADRAVQIHGGAGYMRDSAVERLYRDVRVLRIYEGTTQIQQLLIAKHVLRNASGQTA